MSASRSVSARGRIASLVTIVPHGSKLEVWLYATSRGVGGARPGQEVRLPFDAFPYQRYGPGRGTVTEVSQVPTEPANLDPGLGIEEPVFRVRVRIDELAPRIPTDRRALRPGMTLHANLVLERRSLWQVLSGSVFGSHGPMSGIDWPWSRTMRPVLQSEAAECGLASLTMIGRHYGHRINLPGLRQRYGTSIRGATLQDLMAVASDLELAPRALRLDIEELDKLRLPAVLHWDLNHFVVLEKVGPRSVTILDPARGRRVIALARVSDHFTGVALELTPTPNSSRSMRVRASGSATSGAS